MNTSTHTLLSIWVVLSLTACASSQGPAGDAEATSPVAKSDTAQPAKAKPSVKPDARSDAKSESKPDSKFEAKAQAGLETKQEAKTDVKPELSPEEKAQQLLSEGLDIYNKGDFRNAIRKFQLAKDASAEDSMVRQNSLKYLAFSYCVSSQRALCKAQFVSLLKLAPEYQLERGEAGHPLWGPVFKEAKLDLNPSPTKTAVKKK